jgi:hypothetical protein
MSVNGYDFVFILSFRFMVMPMHPAPQNYPYPGEKKARNLSLNSMGELNERFLFSVREYVKINAYHNVVSSCFL